MLLMLQKHDPRVCEMTAPGVEPGLSRPQRDVLTTGRCGPRERMFGVVWGAVPLVPGRIWVNTGTRDRTGDLQRASLTS